MRFPRLGAPPAELPEVLLVSPPVVPPFRNGTAVLARDLAAHGRAFRYGVLGHRHQPPPGPRSFVLGVYGDGGAPGRIGSAFRIATRVVRPGGADLHHFLFAPHPRAVRVARALATLSRRPSVHTIPSQPSGDADLRRLAFADRTVAVTEATALLLRSAGVAGVEVIRPAVPVPEQPPTREEARRRAGLETAWGDAPAFLYPGDLGFSDGAAVFVEAAALVRAECPEARFALACREKTDRCRAELERLRRRVRALGLEDAVSFLGVVADMPALLASPTAVLLPVDTLYAKVDTPYVLLEALALGVPAIVSDLPPLAELSGLGEGVQAVRRTDPEALAAKVLALAANPSLARRLGDGARRTAAVHFRPDEMAARYEALYLELLAERGPAR